MFSFFFFGLFLPENSSRAVLFIFFFLFLAEESFFLRLKEHVVALKEIFSLSLVERKTLKKKKRGFIIRSIIRRLKEKK